MSYRNQRFVIGATAREHSIERVDFISSQNSNRINGRLRFKQNQLTRSILRASASRRPSRVVGNQYYHMGPALGSSYGVYVPRVSSLKVDADSALRGRIAQVGINAYDLFRTRQQTVDMVTRTLNRLVTGARQIKKRRFKAAARTFGIKQPIITNPNFPQAWLAYQYGWKPLLGDIHTFINKTFPIPKVVAHGTARSHVGFSKVVSKNGAETIYGSGTSQVRGHSRISVAVNGAIIQAASYYGINNPSLVAWEAVPWSFVIDWFYPVGDYLERLGAFAGLSLTEYSYTEWTSHNYDFTFNTKYPHHPANWLQPIERQTAKFVEIRGSRILGPFVANPFPSLGNGLNLTRFANGLSLLAGVFGRKH